MTISLHFTDFCSDLLRLQRPSVLVVGDPRIFNNIQLCRYAPGDDDDQNNILKVIALCSDLMFPPSNAQIGKLFPFTSATFAVLVPGSRVQLDSRTRQPTKFNPSERPRQRLKARSPPSDITGAHGPSPVSSSVRQRRMFA